MARRDLSQLAQLLEIYRQFSPEQKAREELIRAQIAQTNQGVAEGQYGLERNKRFDPVQLDILNQQKTGYEYANQYEKEAIPLKLEQLGVANKISGEEYAARNAQNALNKEMNPLILKLQQETLNPNISLAKENAIQAKNQNSTFDVSQKILAENLKSQQLDNQHAPELFRMNQINNAAQIMQALNLSGMIPTYIPGVKPTTDFQPTEDMMIQRQQLLQSLGGNAVPANIVPNSGPVANMPQQDRDTMSYIQQGLYNMSTHGSQIRRLANKYPDVARRLFPVELKQQLGL